MKPLVFESDTAHVIAAVSLAIVAIPELALGVRTAAAGGRRSDRGTFLLIVAACALAGFIAARTARDDPLPGPAWWPFAAGLALFWAGAALRWWAIVSLGSFFRLAVTTSGDQTVVERGPYRAIRHLSYTGLLLIMAGVGLGVGGWPGVVACIVLPLAAVLRRIAVEEAALERTLGERYRAYAARTPRLVPGVW